MAGPDRGHLICGETSIRAVLMSLDLPTLFVIAIFASTVAGLLLLLSWFQTRNVRALAWWAAAFAPTSKRQCWRSRQMHWQRRSALARQCRPIRSGISP